MLRLAMHRNTVCYCKAGVVTTLAFITSLLILAIFLHRQTPPKPLEDYHLVIRNEEYARESSKRALVRRVFANGQQKNNFTTLSFGSFEEYHQWLSTSEKDQIVNAVSLKRVGKEKKHAKLSRDDLLVHSAVDFSRLVQLEIESFYIQHITDANVFTAYSSVRYLSLQNNSIAVLNPNVFTSLRHLEVLDLRYNDIKHLDVLLLRKLVLLDLSHNPLLTITGLRLGDNSPIGSLFSFQNTSLRKVEFCYQKLLDEQKTANAMVNLGEDHNLKCSCPFLLMRDNLIGQGCVSTDVNVKMMKCGEKFDRADLLCNNYGYIDDLRERNVAQRSALLS